MTAFTLVANSNIDSLTSKAGGDTYDTSGFILTIDQDSRTGLNQTTSTSLGTITINATKGGKCNIDGTNVRLVPFNSGNTLSNMDFAWSFNANTAVCTDVTTAINNATANDVAAPPIQITTAGDALYFGGSAKFSRLNINVGTAKSVTGGVYAWQYWNGAWVTLAVTDNTTFFGTTGTNNVTFTTTPADWATTVVNAQTFFWVRAIATTAPTAITTAPKVTQAQKQNSFVPAWNTTISVSSASGLLIGVYSSFTTASIATLASMPVTGWLKIKQWNTVAYASGTITGIAGNVNCTGVDSAGWLEIVGDESSNVTANRLGQFNVTGSWFNIGTTNGSSNQTMQIPNNGLSRYVAGVYIEQTSGQGNYEFYPNAGTTTTTGTESARGKVVWIDATGLVRIGNSGAGTNGYTPVTGLAVVIGNVFLENCTTALRTANAIPNATVGTRYTFVCTGGGAVSFNKTNCAWYLNATQPYSVALTNSCFVDAILVDEIATAISWNLVGVGNKPTTALSVAPLTATICYNGGTITNSVFARVTQASSGNHTITMTDCAGFTFTGCTFRGNTIRGNATAYALIGTRLVNCTFTNHTNIQGAMNLVTCTNVKTNNLSYIDAISGTTTATFGQSVFLLATNTQSCTFSGLNYPVTNNQAFTSIMNLLAAGCSNIRLRNIGTYVSPLNLGTTNPTGLIYIFANSAAAADIYIQCVYCSNTGTGQMTADNSSTRITVETVFGDYADAADVATPLNYKRKGIGGTLALTAQTAIYGTHWFDCYTANNAGRLGLLMNESSPLTTTQVTLSNGAAFTAAGGLYMPTIGMIAVFETPYYVIGHTAFQNVAPTMAGGTASNYTLEYQIDLNNGNGYGSWTAMTGTNLSGISTINAQLGFKMKWRITTSTTNATGITSLYVTTSSTTTSQAYQYPLDLVTVSVTVLDVNAVAIPNARVAIYKSNAIISGQELLSALTNVSGIATSIVSYVADQSIIIRVRGETPVINIPINSSFGTASTGGSLSNGTYYYRVSATNDIGETLASTETSITISGGTSTQTISVNWGAIVGATGYKIYGRSTGAELFIASVGAVTTYLDTGSITPLGALPLSNTTGGKRYYPIDASGTITSSGYSALYTLIVDTVASTAPL